MGTAQRCILAAMSSFVPLWPRNAPPDDHVAEIVLVCFSRGRLRDDVPLRVDLCGLPSRESFALADIRTHPRAENPEWFDNWRSGAAGIVAKDHLGARIADLEAADTCCSISVSLTPGADFGYLQAAWAIARHVVERGATVILDAHAARFLEGSKIRAVPDAFDVQRELLTVIESDSRTPGGDHIMHTRGMRKLGRPDVGALVGPEDVRVAASIIRQITNAIGNGPLPMKPRHGVDVSENVTLYLVPDPGQLAEDVGLNNDAILLVDENGGSLRGLAARLA